jgi:CheY-like chemotaxis protein
MSEENVGTSFFFSIPFSLAAPLQQHPATRTSTRSAGSRLKILLAEDDAISRMVVSKVLEIAGHHVSAVQNGREVLEALHTNQRFDVLIVDIQMPIMDGVEVTHCVRSTPEFKEHADIPIIAMTAHAMTGDKEAFLKSGMDFYVAKPVDPSKLITVLERVTAGRRE